ncbi:bifunctional oligoribonuclease/PAP phosphatase NrnA [Leuconostoc suionicum]|uniref:Bifunctional oligoribonuclease and PAP phosphatase NrnA n=1 Tax=Leuconostoc suionicum TaxID=1511761 RepID=A0A2N9K7H2_9LACO|nr:MULTISPECIES: bifunctional oligoribonuclease/PAP phosphatase NrnA [Leuconostoc]API72540.1 phosphoesterase [Leuconostoc suionicum]MBE4728519.1 bifunctional oligoribonuclease/PAP phosphatase NrnA [Leuconostoc suionicum]MCT4403197.1 bifunctional oligoribonuclease/PAP phosphatase NrnA [Leuconostoc suionicum]MDI6498235.1 bifunctional oligoribonuclease/PAP phosphatase NrnA [Leuconostoc suionicum]MDI6500270.1 bifunctional oligoribonuclease/PAP phosphatase NrnA [Leuconostoc suionicum]
MSVIEEQILEQIKRYDTIIIHRHQRPDPDAFGSQLGLKEILKASFPEKKIYAVGKEVQGLAWINEDDNFMDVIPDATYNKALVIVTDTANAPRVDDQRWPAGLEVIKIDHHPNDEPYGDWQWVKDGHSATSTMIFEFYEKLKDQGLVMTKKAARLLYIGIIGDTGRFMYSIDSETFRVVSELFKYDFDYQEIHHAMATISENAAKLSGYVLQNISILPSGFAYVILTKELLKQFDLKDAGTAFVVPLPSKIDCVKSWAIFEEQDEGNYRVRLRSRTIAINKIANQFEGGGHPMASGAWAQNQGDIDRLINIVDSALSEKQDAEKED